MPESPPATADSDPIRHAARIIADDQYPPLERRLKHDIFNSLCRIKPGLREQYDFERDVMPGTIFPDLSPPLQGIAIARTEGAIAFYNRVGWHAKFIDEPLQSCVREAEHIDTLKQRYHASTLHDLAYVHPKHYEKMLGKAGAASLWETLKSWSSDQPAPPSGN